MAATYTFIQSDMRPFLAVIVKDVRTNEVVDLTGTTVTFYFKHQLAKVAKVSGSACTITQATAGKVEYRWASTDLDVPGIYDAEFRIAHTDTKPQRVRIAGIEVLEKLG